MKIKLSNKIYYLKIELYVFNDLTEQKFKIKVKIEICIYIMIINYIFHRHENATGFYRVSVYFMCKLVFDVIPMRIIPVMGFSVVVYFMIG